MIREFTNFTPTADKMLVLIGTAGTAIGLSDVSSTVGVAVGVVTLCMIVPRAIMNWNELIAEREKRRKARRLLKEADRESSDY